MFFFCKPSSTLLFSVITVAPVSYCISQRLFECKEQKSTHTSSDNTGVWKGDGTFHRTQSKEVSLCLVEIGMGIG